MANCQPCFSGNRYSSFARPCSSPPCSCIITAKTLPNFDYFFRCLGLRVEDEDAAFDEDRYLADLFPQEEDPILTEALAFEPHWKELRRPAVSNRNPGVTASRYTSLGAPPGTFSTVAAPSGVSETISVGGHPGSRSEKQEASDEATHRAAGGVEVGSTIGVTEGEDSLDEGHVDDAKDELCEITTDVPNADVAPAMTVVEAKLPTLVKGRHGAEKSESGVFQNSEGVIAAEEARVSPAGGIKRVEEESPAAAVHGNDGSPDGDSWRVAFKGFNEEEQEQMR